MSCVGFLLLSAAIVCVTSVVPVICEVFLLELLFMLLYHFVYIVV